MIHKIKIRAAVVKRFLWFYGISMLLVLATLFLVFLYKNNYAVVNTADFFQDLIPHIVTSPIFYIISLAPYLLFLLVKSLVYDYKQASVKGLLKGAFLKIILPVMLLFMGNKVLQNYRLSETINYTWNTTIENKLSTIKDFYGIDQKQRGIHVFNISQNLEDIEQLKTNNFEWITITPFIDQGIYNKPSLRLISDENYKNRLKRYKTIKEACDKFGMKIMLKPHIWLLNTDGGKWRSDIEMDSEDAWTTWFENYSQVILKYAEIAAVLKLEQFCIGTELETTVSKKPEQWNTLIQRIKSIYSGKLTYAANWHNEYEAVPFWDALDYIGIQAYFPLSETNNPTLEVLENNWEKHIEDIKLVSEKFNKPVLFTEIGYKSIQGTSQKPWEWNGIKNVYSKISKKEQLLCYQAFFNTVWKAPWFHGIHVWEWQAHGISDGNNANFTLEGKPALNLIATYFNL